MFSCYSTVISEPSMALAPASLSHFITHPPYRDFLLHNVDAQEALCGVTFCRVAYGTDFSVCKGETHRESQDLECGRPGKPPIQQPTHLDPSMSHSRVDRSSTEDPQCGHQREHPELSDFAP